MMAEVSDPKEPIEMSASIPPLEGIITEGNRAIGTQARAAVDSILANGGFADPNQLRKWGPRGAKYFFDILQKRIAEKPKLQKAVGPVATKRVVKRRRAAVVGGQRAKRKVFRRKRPPLSTQHDWASQHHNRWPTRMRAIAHGMLVAAVLFAGAAVLIRLSPTLVPFIPQQIQAWR